MKRSHLELYVEELVLDGLGNLDEHMVREAVSRELSRLFESEGVPRSLAVGGEVPHLDSGSFQVTPGADAAAVGAQVARSLYGGLTR